jgi:hypothetical protein
MFVKLLVALSILNFNSVVLQPSESSILKSARNAYNSGDFAKAKEKYLELLVLNPNSLDYNFEAGLSYISSDLEREKALTYFEKANSLDKEQAIPEIIYYCGISSHYNEEYQKAIDYFLKFKPFIDPKTGQELISTIENNIRICKNALELDKEDWNSKYELKNLGNKVNSEFYEYGSVITSDENKMYFTSRKRGTTGGKKYHDGRYFEDIYIAIKENENWVSTMKIDTMLKHTSGKINTNFHNAPIAFNHDETKLYLYRNSDIYESSLIGNLWSEPVKMSENINSDEYEPSIFISEDDNYLLLVSNRKDGMGGRDLYYSEKKSSNEWSIPINIGSDLNTALDEDAPFLTKDGKTLYFSSKGHNSMGGYDIFKSEKDENGKWSKPINLGKPFNSPADDIYYSESDDRKEFFLSSNRKNGLGGMDIWSINELEKDTLIVANDTTTIEKDTIITTPVKLITSSSFEENFTYNAIEIKGTKMDFNAFIKETGIIINQKGSVEIFIQSSASKVPTTTFKTNKKLSEKRAEWTKERIEKALNDAGFPSEKFKIKTESSVQGPNYKNDYETNMTEYEKYQFIKVVSR